MKKINIQGKLNLNKETITRLNDQAMASIQGGGGELGFGLDPVKTTDSSKGPATSGGNSSPCNLQTCGSPSSTCLYLNGC